MRAAAEGPETELFLEGLRRAVDGMGADFSDDRIVTMRRGGSLLVDALINGRLTARLIVDTGASLTAISSRLAERLGVDFSGPGRNAVLIQADGSRIVGKAVVLDSIQVGQSTVERVQVVILPSVGSQEDGLLGMTFLREFTVQIDSDNNLLLIKKVR